MMRSAEDLFQELLSLDESHRIEVKRGTQIDRSAMETVCAFANEPSLGGGYLLLGVARDQQDLFSNAYVVEGVTNSDKIQSDLASQCAVTFNRPVRPRISVGELNGKVVVVYVPESPPTDKPVYLTNLGLPRGAYRRVGPTDQEGSEDDLIALYAGLPPTLESSRRPDHFVATFLFHHFLRPDDLAWLRRLTTEPISDEEARALVFVRELGAIDNAAYRSINRTDTLNASGHLRRLRDLQLLEMKGSGSRTYYAPGSAFVTPLAQAVDDRHQIISNSHRLVNNSRQPDDNTHQANTNPLLASVPVELKTRVPPLGNKPRREVLRVLIEDLCRWQNLSARELAAILNGREHKPLVRDYLSPMVNEGVLAYTNPAMENHPDQRYTVPSAGK